MVLAILILSLALQAAAIVLALRLIALTRQRAAWILIAAAIGLMGVRRAMTLGRAVLGEAPLPPDAAVELVALVISGLMLAGIARIRGVFLAIQRAEADLRASEASRQELELSLARAEKMEAIGRLAGGVAHDFNNLLTAILCGVEQAERALPPGHAQRATLAEAHGAALRAGDLSRQLLAISRRQPVEVVALDPAQLLTRVEATLRPLLPPEVELVVRAAPGPSVLADPLQLERVLLNLAINARDAMPDGGRLELQVAESGGEGPVRIVVKDTGVGMDPATLARAFEPFFTTKGARGSGLGLSTAQGIVSQLGGSISAASAPGAGTTMTIALPRGGALEAAAALSPAPAREEPGGAPRILVVDDEAPIRTLLQETLTRGGYQVLAVGDGEAALALLSERPGELDLLVTDCVMPGMSGLELAREVHRRWPGTAVLLISGYLPEAEVDLPCLLKPFGPDELERRVAELLAGRALGAAGPPPRA